MSKEQFERLLSKLDTLIKVSAASAFHGKSKEESILILSDLDFGPTEIAKVLGTTPAYVNKVKYEAKKARKETKQEKGGMKSDQDRP